MVPAWRNVSVVIMEAMLLVADDVERGRVKSELHQNMILVQRQAVNIQQVGKPAEELRA